MSKSKRGKSASANEISKWETELIQAQFHEETWISNVFFIAPGKFEDNLYIDILCNVVSTGLRKLFSVITEESLMKDVREFGKGQSGGGKGKGGSTRPPPFFEVCEQAKAILDQGEPIPPSLMAKVLKFKLLQIKQKDLERREEEKKAAKAAEAAKKEDKGKKSRSPSGKRSKSPGKKKGKKEADVPASPKKDTKLKRRGDVEDTFKTIDDEPDDYGCPQHYILIHGILMPVVIQYLGEIGITVHSIICIKSETYDKFEVSKEKQEEATEEQDPEDLEKAIQEEERVAHKKEFENRLEMFWKDSDSLVLKAQSGSKLKDIAKYTVLVRDKDVPEEDLQEISDEKKTEFGTILFEDVAVTCYNMLDHYSLYRQYLESMKLLHIPVHTTAPSQPLLDIPSSQSVMGTTAPDTQTPIHVEVDTRYYKHLMDSVPPESHSVPLLLHCMLEQATVTVDENNPLDKEIPPRVDGLNHLLADHINSKANKLSLSIDDKKSISGNLNEDIKPKNSDVPILLHHGDDLTVRARHLQSQNNLDPMQAELKMLQFTQCYVGEIPVANECETVERAASTNELHHFLKSKSVDPDILEQALKQYAFEGMLLKSVSDNGDIINPVDLDEAFKSYCNPWDYPYSRLEDFMKVKFCSDESGKLKISEIESNSPLTSFRNLDDWCFMEHFDNTTLLQVLDKARFTLPYMDTYFHKKDHSLLIALHNPAGQDCRSQFSWKTKLHSNVGFRNYLDNVATSINSWINEQERIKMEAAKTPTPPPIIIEETPAPLKEGSRYGLMTRTEVNALKAEEEEKNKKGKGKKSARGSRSPGRNSAKTKDTSDKKGKDKKRDGSAGSRPKSGRSSAKGSQSNKSASGKDKKGSRSRSRLGSPSDFVDETPSQPIETPVDESYDFIGYDVGDNLIHASGSLSTLFPSDGGQIRVDKNSYVQGTNNVRVSVHKDGNMFILHFLKPLDAIQPKEDTQNTIQTEQDENNDSGNVDEHIEKSEIEGTEKETLKVVPEGPKPFCDFSSFVAQFSDGMILTHSGYGPLGSIIDRESKDAEVATTTIAVPDGGATAHGTPSPQPKASSPKSRKKMDEEAKRMEELLQQQEEEKQRLEEEAKKRAEEEKRKKPFQHYYITCPDGLHVEYFNDGEYNSVADKGGVCVRQGYPVKGHQQDGNERQKPAMEELSRTLLTNGTVIKFMKNNGIQVLFADGATSKCQSYPLNQQPSPAIVNKPPEAPPAKKGPRTVSSQKSSEEPSVPVLSLPDNVPQWVSTGVGGARVGTKADGQFESIDGVLYSVATCAETGQVLRTREDNVVTVERPDGSVVVEHEDGTRITTFYVQIERQTQAPDNETGDQAQYDTFQGKFIKVECPGFATVVFNESEGSCGTIFGNGVNIETCADGVSTVDRPDGSQLHIDGKGVISYVSRNLAGEIDLAGPTNEPAEPPEGLYIMRSADQLCCEVKDNRGYKFTVMSNGEASIDKTAAKDRSSSHETALVPRYFVVHQDGSGFELLRQSDISEVLSRGEKDPDTAVLRSPVEGLHQATCVTMLRPYSGGITKVWLMKKDEDVIVPHALRERDFKAFPAKEEKRPGTKFGTNVGAGLNVGDIPKKQPPLPTVTCPSALEVRQLVQYKPLTDEHRRTIVKCMKEYGEYVAKRQEKLDSILPQDPRDESEKLRAEKLDSKTTEDKHDSLNNERVSNNEHQELSSGTVREALKNVSNDLQGDGGSQKYIEAITPVPVPAHPPPRWKRPKEEWEQDKIELAELEYGKHALRHKEVPPYFDTSDGQLFLRHEYNHDDINLEVLTSRLAEQTRRPPPGEGSVPDTPRSDSDGIQKSVQDFSSPEVLQQVTNSSINDATSPSANTLSPNNLRPTNPTPAHATGDGTPTPLRPNNPTPAHASSKPANVRPSNPTPKQAADQQEGLVTNDSPNYDSNQWRTNLESVQEVAQPEEGHGIEHGSESLDNGEVLMDTPGNPMTGAKSLYMDVTGAARKDKVKLPSSILSSKPGALPNTQFIETEDPVRRRVNTVSVAGGNKITPGRVDSLRGFEVLPPKVSFGVLKEGCTYIHTVLMKNVGVDSCRFKIKQPPPSTGLRVLYNPGPVAAGMNTKLDVEIFAVAVGVVGETGVGQVGHHVEIVTETDVIYLPVYATIMTSHEYENHYGDQMGGLSKGTTLIPNRPPSRDPTRPRKAVDYEIMGQIQANQS